MTQDNIGLPVTADHSSETESHISSLEYRLEETQRELRQLRKSRGYDEPRDRRGPGGTPNRSGDISSMLAEGRPSDVAFMRMDEDNRVLHNAVEDGPDAFVPPNTPTYPVHERAEDVLVHAQSLAREKSADGSTVFLTSPSVKRFLEYRSGERLKHTQVRRVFEQLEQAGANYPRPPILHKNRDGVVELVLFDWDRILGAPL